jgi:heme-degrading monooxygenase HmoA
MIARIWSGRIRAADVDDYVDYVRRTGVATQRATTGNQGSMILTRPEGETVDVTVISFWDSRSAVRGFAGDDPERAIFFPEDDRYLVDADQVVRHYDIPVREVPPA